MELDELRRLFNEWKDALIKTYNADGGGIGKDDEGLHIVLYTSNPSLLQSSQPHFWNGQRIVFKYIGKVRPL